MVRSEQPAAAMRSSPAAVDEGSQDEVEDDAVGDAAAVPVHRVGGVEFRSGWKQRGELEPEGFGQR